MEQTKLSRSTLRGLIPSVRKPLYDPTRVEPGIVHVGLGNFHRAHMARFTHDLMQGGAGALQWGIIGAGLLPADKKMHDALAVQDRLYTLIERDQSDETVSVIGSLAGLIYAGDDSRALIEAINREQIRIVSLTITEHGYCLNGSTKTLDFEHPLIAADLLDPTHPRSAIGVLAEGFRRRMVAGRRAFTALSCDNIQHNGRVLRDAVLKFASVCDPVLAEWIATQARFPNTMVDRITPVTAASDVADLAEQYGVVDNWPVFSERFIQWVIEDDFADGRPAWDDVGVQFVEDVAPYEFMKLRLLNASHLAVAGIGALLRYRYVDEAMGDPRLRTYMQRLMDDETGQTLLPVPGIDLAVYKRTLIRRFENPKIKDTVQRVNTDAPVNYLLDPIRDRLRAGQSLELLAFALAAWLRRVRGVDDHGNPIEVTHPLAELLRERAVEGGPDPRPLLEITSLFGELSENTAFVERVTNWLGLIYMRGIFSALDVAIF